MKSADTLYSVKVHPASINQLLGHCIAMRYAISRSLVMNQLGAWLDSNLVVE